MSDRQEELTPEQWDRFVEQCQHLADTFQRTVVPVIEEVVDAVVAFGVALDGMWCVSKEQALIEDAIDWCGVTEVDIRKVDVDTRIVTLWNWRKIEVPW